MSLSFILNFSLQDDMNKTEVWQGYFNEKRPLIVLVWEISKEFGLKNGTNPSLHNKKESDLLTSEASILRQGHYLKPRVSSVKI